MHFSSRPQPEEVRPLFELLGKERCGKIVALPGEGRCGACHIRSSCRTSLGLALRGTGNGFGGWLAEKRLPRVLLACDETRYSLKIIIDRGATGRRN